MLHWIICSKNQNIGNIWQEVSSYIQMKLVHAGAPSVLLFSIGKLRELTSSSWKLIEILILLNSYIDWIKYLGRNKVFHHHERQKLVHAGALSVFLFLMGKLQDLTSSSSKIIEIWILLKCYTGLCLKRKNIGNVPQEVSSVTYMNREKLLHAGAPSVILFLIGKLQNLTSSCSKLIEILIFLGYTGLSVRKTKIFFHPH